MTKNQRRSLVLVLVGLFFAVTPVVLLYSQGYRINWKNGQITQTGAFYLKAIPSRTDIAINGVFQRKTDFIFDSTLLGNFLPKSYVVSVRKDGYTSWSKTLEIKPKEVTEARNILLFPSQIAFKTALENVLNFWPSPDSTKIVFQKAIPGQKWQLYLLNLETNEQRVIMRQKTAEDIWDISWSQDSSKILIQIASGETLKNSVLNLAGSANDSCAQTPCDLQFLGQLNTPIIFSATTDGEIFYLTNANVLTEANYLEQSIKSTPIAKNVVTFALNSNVLVWLGKDGMVWQKDISTDADPIALTNAPYPIQNETHYTLTRINNSLFLQEGGGQLLTLSQNKTFKKILGTAATLVPSPDEKKIAISNGSEVWIYYLANETDQPRRNEGEVVFLKKFSAKPANLAWINDHELILSAGNAIQALEIDTRSSLNIADIASYANPKLLWEPKTKTLAVLSEGKLLFSEKLIH